MKLKINKNTASMLALCVVAVCLFIYIRCEFTFNFVALFSFLILFMIIPLCFAGPKIQERRNPNTLETIRSFAPDRNFNDYQPKLLVLVLAILVFGMMALYALGNYCNPEKAIYKNYDHHALKVEGLKIDEGFCVAGTKRNAFLDNPTIRGSVKVEGYDEDSVYLRLDGLTNPLYRRHMLNKELTYSCLNKNTLVGFKSGDWVKINGYDNEDNRRSISFQLIEEHEPGFLGRHVDSTRCFFIEQGSQDTLESSFHRYIKSGYSLEGIAADVSTRQNLRGIRIVRGAVSPHSKRSNLQKLYQGVKYYIELESDAKVDSIQVNDAPAVTVNSLQASTTRISIPFESAFFLGSGENVSETVRFMRHPQDSSLTITYHLAKYRRLSSNEQSDENSVMVTTNILNTEEHDEGKSGLIENLTDNVLWFDLFHEDDNKCNLKPFFLSYVGGPTNEAMEFSLISEDSPSARYGVKADVYLSDVKSRSKHEWLIKVENFKDKTPFRSTKLAWILLAVILLSALSLLYSESLYTGFEYACYLLIIAFLTIRFFLLWRVTVFPPLSSITHFEFTHFMSERWLNVTLLGLGFFFLVVNLVKRVVVKKGGVPDDIFDSFCRRPIVRFIQNKLFRPIWWIVLFLPRLIVRLCCRLLNSVKSRRTRQRISDCEMSPRTEGFVGSIIIMLLVDTIALVVAKVSGSPVLTVLGSIVIYLLTDGLIYWYFGDSYRVELEKLRNAADYADPVRAKSDAFLMSLCNMLLITTITLAADGGYGVMFSLFMLFSLWLKITDLYQYTRYTMKSSERHRVPWSLIAFWALFVIILFVVIQYKSIFISLFDSIMGGREWIFFMIAGGVVCLMSVLVTLVLDIKFRKSHLIIPLLVSAFCVCAALKGPEFLRGSHMEYRTRVHMEEAGEILFKVENATQQNKFLQASLNDWILYEYQNIGDDVKSFGEGGNGYFKLQPQSKLGAMWFAQTTDICISRYIIAEHGGALPKLFVIAFAMLLMMALKMPSTSRWSRIITVQVSLILAVQSLMILLANTRAFIFFGQDFPLISVTSRLSSLYFFILLAVAVCTCIIGRSKHYYEVERLLDGYEMYAKLHEKNKALAFHMLFFFSLSAILLAFLGKDESLNLGVDKGKKSESVIRENELGFEGVSYYKDGMYDVDTLLTVVNKELEAHINPAFVDYQRRNGIEPLKRNMSEYVNEVFSDSLMLSAYNLCCSYTQRLLETYKNTGSKDNSVKNIVCLRNVRTYEYKRVRTGKNAASSFRVIPRDTLEFVTSLDFYKYELPTKAKKVWRGNIIESSKHSIPDSAYFINSDKWSCAFVPGRYTASGKAVQLISPTTGKPLKLVGSDAIISVKRDSLCVANVTSDDFVMIGSRTITDTPLQNFRYFARCILLNGNNTFVYPNGHKMLWARDVVAAKLRRERHSGNASPEDLEKDMVLTIDTRLNNALYDTYAANTTASTDNVARDRAVVVADGRGNIRAMVDYRSDPRFRINPNDFRRIAELSDSLYMNREKGRTIESRFFGNFSRNVLRRGPGSTQKPIVWTAVTSMYNIGWWDKLSLATPVNIPGHTIDGKYFIFREYAGYPIESKFRSIAGDEGAGSNRVTLQSYMYKSSNYYNSLLAYIGSFQSSDLDRDGFLQPAASRDQNGLFYTVSVPQKPVLQKNQSLDSYNKAIGRYADQYIGMFPVIQKGDGKTMSFNKFLTRDMALDTTALLPRGLSSNFGLSPKVSRSVSSKDPRSYFNMSVRNKNVIRGGVVRNEISNRELNEYMVRSVAIGNNAVWNVTPVKMAEMYGRLISLNQEYRLSYEEGADGQYQMFDMDESWARGYMSYKPVRAELLKGMSQVFGRGGTAYGVYTIINSVVGQDQTGAPVRLSLDTGEGRKSLYIYGKTGTINGFWGAENKEDHLLATIITDREVSSCSAKELEEMKFFVIYQVDFANPGGWVRIDGEIIETVLNSQAFKDYMGIK